MARSSSKKILSVVLSILLIFGVVTAGVVLLKPKETKRIYPVYHVGSIDDENGKYVESDDSIYSDMFECQGLKVVPTFKSDVNYNLYFYRFDETFVYSVTDKSETYEVENDDTIRYARIVITPALNGENIEEHKIWFWEVLGISNALKIMVNAEQEELKNLAIVEKDESCWAGCDHTENWVALEGIDISNVSKLALVFDSVLNKEVLKNVEYQFSETATSVKSLDTQTLDSKILIFDVSSFAAKQIYFSMKEDLNLKIYVYEYEGV